MTYDEITEMLEQTGLPLAYDHFVEGEAPAPPFLIFLFPRSDIFPLTAEFIKRLMNSILNFIRT